jgi:iron complex transport system substrate-binding protein
MTAHATGTTVLLLALVGCGVQPPAEPPAGPPAPADGFPRTVTDSGGQSLTLPARPVRIVSTAPTNTETLFAVGAGPQVVGVTTYCNFPAEAAAREKVGGFSPKSISTERIVGLKPDLVVTTGRLQQSVADELRRLGLPVLSYDAQTLDDVLQNVRLIGRAVGREAEADALAADLDRRRARVRERVAARPAEARPTVLLLLSDDPLMTAGPKTFPGQLLEEAGGRNVFADVEQQFPRVSEEEIVRRDPGVILLWEWGDFAARRERLTKRPGWERLDAVRAGRVVGVNDDLLSRAGPRLFDGLERVADLLHPPKI